MLHESWYIHITEYHTAVKKNEIDLIVKQTVFKTHSLKKKSILSSCVRVVCGGYIRL